MTLLPFVVGFSTSYVLLYVLFPFLSRFFSDSPNFRSSHVLITPRGGGIVFVLISSVASFWATFDSSLDPSASFLFRAAPLISLPLAIFGFIDDYIGLSRSIRYFVQLLTAIVVILLCPFFDGFVYWYSFLLFLFLLFSATAVTNFVNFMDGLDGIVCGSLFVAFSVVAFLHSSSFHLIVTLGALLAFLCWNWSPARIFMGDVGSTFLGSVYFSCVISSSSWVEAFSLMLLITPLLADPFVCLLRRFFSGQPVFHAHRLHLFQRLHQAGWTHARVSTLYIMAIFVLGVALLFGGLSWLIILASLELLIGLLLDLRVAVPFTTASRS